MKIVTDFKSTLLKSWFRAAFVLRSIMKGRRSLSGLKFNLVLTQQCAAETSVHGRFHIYEVSGIKEVLTTHDLAQSFKVQILKLLVVYAQQQ